MTNIVLVCAAGMSTSMLVQKMKAAAQEKGIEANIKAVAESDFSNHSSGVQVLLLGPQVRFKLEDFKAAWEPKGIKVDVINQVDYGRMNGLKVLQDALAMLGR